MSTLERKTKSRPGPLEAMPPLATFAQRYDAGDAQVVWMRLVADLETPVSAYLKLAAGRPMSFLLESVEGGAARGRYSVIGLEPDLVWRAEGDKAGDQPQPDRQAGRLPPRAAGNARLAARTLKESELRLPPELPPMSAGIFGYMGYDTVRLMERLPQMPDDALGIPDAILMRPTVMAIFDVVKDEITIVTPVRNDTRLSAEKAYKAACKRLKAVVAALNEPLPHAPSTPSRKLPAPRPSSNTTAAEYKSMVQRAKEYIVAGDIFQVVLSQRFSAPFTLSPFALYRALRRTNPSPFLFHLDFGGFALVGSSPEILVRVRNGEVTIRPIAGTAPRGETDAEDQALAEALLNDPKERAEHLMLLDLGRNDVGRVARSRHRRRDRALLHRALQPRDAHRLQRDGQARRRSRRGRRADGGLSRGHGVGRAEGARDGDHRRAGEVEARALCRLRRLLLRRRPDGYLHRAAHRAREGRHDARAGGRRARARSVPEKEQQECINKAQALFRAAEEAVRFAARAK